jgi:hypothetical protein
VPVGDHPDGESNHGWRSTQPRLDSVPSFDTVVVT